MPLIERPALTQAVIRALDRSPCAALLGPRQCGKTTLARSIASSRPCEFLDLEDPSVAARLENASLTLGRMRGLVIIDEVQLRPELFGLLRVLLDREGTPARFLLLGSASPGIVRGASESLAGRVEFVMMGGFGLQEVGADRLEDLWLRGTFPRSLLAGGEEDSYAWRRDFVQTFLERDLRNLGVNVAPEMLRRFLTMLAHHHGGAFNSSDIASSLQVAHTTTRRYLDLMSGAFLVRQLPPWFENVGKRVVKSPKVYVRDPGLLHLLLGIRTRAELEAHPKFGSSWEGFALEEILRSFDERDAYFWGTYAGAELDLLIAPRGRRLGFEFKVTDAPRTTKAMRVALSDLELEHLYVVHPGETTYPLDDRITALALRGAAELLGAAR